MKEVEIIINNKKRTIKIKPINVGQQEEYFKKVAEIIKSGDATKILEFLKYRNQLISTLTDLTVGELKNITVEEINKIFLPISNQMMTIFTTTLPQQVASFTEKTSQK